MDTPDADQTRTLAGERVPALSLGQYKLAQRLGEGGMGTVWLARADRARAPAASRSR